jgi:hypothetical protein
VVIAAVGKWWQQDRDEDGERQLQVGNGFRSEVEGVVLARYRFLNLRLTW